MGILDNVKKTVGESKIGGIKNKMYWAPKSIITACPQLLPMDDRTIASDYKILVGDFVFVDPLNDKFNSFEFDVSAGELKWKSEGATAQTKVLMLNFEMEVSTLDASLYQFIEKYKNEDLILLIERADCSGEIYLFGGCCQPAVITAIEGSLGKDAKTFGSTKFAFEAYSNGLPPVLAADTVIPVYDTPPSSDFSPLDFDPQDFS